MDDTSAALPRWSASVASDEAYTLGEGPLWDPVRQRLLWVDIMAGAVHEGRLAGDRVEAGASHTFHHTVGAVGCARSGDLLVAGEYGLVVLTADGRRLTGPDLLAAGSTSRLNDGKCDPAGAFVVGSMARDDRRGEEFLVRIDPDGVVTVLDDDLTLSNGLAWRADGREMYSIDSVPGVVWVRSYDPADGAAGPRRELLRITDATPDGMCLDAEGNLWIAVWGAGQVRRYTPDGVLTGVVDVPAPHPTSAAFVGADLDVLLITTATAEMSAEQLRDHPDAGRLFVARVGATGRPEAAWAGPSLA